MFLQVFLRSKLYSVFNSKLLSYFEQEFVEYNDFLNFLIGNDYLVNMFCKKCMDFESFNFRFTKTFKYLVKNCQKIAGMY